MMCSKTDKRVSVAWYLCGCEKLRHCAVIKECQQHSVTNSLPEFISHFCWAQVEGAQGLTVLKNKMKIGGPRVLYHGALAASAATFVGAHPQPRSLEMSLNTVVEAQQVKALRRVET